MGFYLVTGAAGFIGASLARKLLREGHRVVSIDNLSTGRKENVPKGVQLLVAGCHDKMVYDMLPKKPFDAIFHIAGQSSGEISFDDPIYDLATNTQSTLLLLKFALENGCQRFIYASSMSVYGNKHDGPVLESVEAKPVSFYGVGKLASEHYLRIYEQFGIRTTSLRLFNVYGPGQNMLNMRQGMVSIFMAQMLKDKYICVKGSKYRYRDFVYIEDVVKAFMACLNSPKAYGKIINVATGKKTSVKELVNIMIENYSKEVICEYYGSTPGDVHGIIADITLAKRTLGYVPSIELNTGISLMLEWAKNYA